MEGGKHMNARIETQAHHEVGKSQKIGMRGGTDKPT
jgi:hypothetical protein